MNTWTMAGQTYRYVEPRKFNERDIELPWAARILGNATGSILEVGNATQQEGVRHPPRTIVDRWDCAGGLMPVERADIVDWDGGPYDLILSVSTLEHVGTDEQEEKDDLKALVAVGHCMGLLAPGGLLAFTFGCGYHSQLQAYVLEDSTMRVHVMGRDHQFASRWEELTVADADCEFPWEWKSAKRVLFVRYRKPQR